MPCYHNLERYLIEYLECTWLGADPKAWLLPTIRRGTDELTTTPLPQANAMIQLLAKREGLKTKIGNLSFRATGITTYLKKQRHARKGRRHGEPCLYPDHTALRPAVRRRQFG